MEAIQCAGYTGDANSLGATIEDWSLRLFENVLISILNEGLKEANFEMDANRRISLSVSWWMG
jgi:hypothetical protein